MTRAPTPSAGRKFRRLEFLLLRLWHALLFGAFVVAYLTGDEDTYDMHFFAGYVVLGAIALRLIMAAAAPADSPLRLARPSLAAVAERLRGGKGRNPIFAWMAAVVLLGVGLAAFSGALADPIVAIEDLHEGISELSLWVVLGHAAVIVFLFQGRRLMARLFPKHRTVA